MIVGSRSKMIIVEDTNNCTDGNMHKHMHRDPVLSGSAGRGSRGVNSLPRLTAP